MKMIQITEEKAEKLSEGLSKMMRIGGKLMECLQDIEEEEAGAGGMRGGYRGGMRGGYRGEGGMRGEGGYRGGMRGGYRDEPDGEEDGMVHYRAGQRSRYDEW